MQPCSKCGLTEMCPDHSTMTVNLGCPRRACWNSLQNWLASPVHAPWMHEALAMGSPWARASAWHCWTRAGLGRRAASALQPCLYSGIPLVPALPFAPPCLQHTYPRTRKRSHCFRHASPYRHGHTPVTGASGRTCGSGALGPCAKRMPRPRSCLDAAGPGVAPWCRCPPFVGSAGSDHCSLPPSAAWGWRWDPTCDIPTGKVLLPA